MKIHHDVSSNQAGVHHHHHVGLGATVSVKFDSAMKQMGYLQEIARMFLHFEKHYRWIAGCTAFIVCAFLAAPWCLMETRKLTRPSNSACITDEPFAELGELIAGFWYVGPAAVSVFLMVLLVTVVHVVLDLRKMFGETEFLTFEDSLFKVVETPRWDMTIHGQMQLEGHLHWELLEPMFKKLIDKQRRLRHCIVPYKLPFVPASVFTWYALKPDPKFDLANHVHIVNLPLPHELGLELGHHGAYNEFIRQMLQDKVDKFINSSLDPSLPVWQNLIINYNLVVQETGSLKEASTLVFKMHHCISDGVSSNIIILSMTTDENGKPFEINGYEIPKKKSNADDEPSVSDSGAVTTRAKRPRKGVASVVKACETVAKNIIQLFDSWIKQGTASIECDPCFKHVVHPYHGRFSLSAAKRQQHRKHVHQNRYVSGRSTRLRKTFATSEPIPLDRIKAIKNGLGCTVTDVIFACAAGVMREHSLAEGHIPKHEVMCSVPISWRKRLEMDEQISNRNTGLSIFLPIHLADPLARLKHVATQTARFKQYPVGAGFNRLFMNVLCCMPPFVIRLVLREWYFGMIAGIVTNIPGPQHQIFLGGVPVKTLAMFTMQPFYGKFSLAVSSYNDHMTLNVATEEDSFSDPRTVVDLFNAEIVKLSKIVEDSKHTCVA